MTRRRKIVADDLLDVPDDVLDEAGLVRIWTADDLGGMPASDWLTQVLDALERYHQVDHDGRWIDCRRQPCSDLPDQPS